MISKRKTIIFLVIIGIVILIFFGFLIYLQLKGVKKTSEELISVKKELILFQSKAGELERFKKTYQELEPNLKRIDSLFVDPEVPIELITFLENIAQESGLLIEISPALIKPTEADPWKSLGFQLVLTGPPQNFLRFLEKIETGPYLTEVQNLVITRQEEKARGGDVKATLLVKVFTK